MRMYYFLEARKWAMILKIGGIILFNLLLFLGTAIYYWSYFFYVLAIQLVIDLIFVWGFSGTRKTMGITQDSLIIFYLYKKEIYPFSDMQSIRFFYSIETDSETGQIIGRTNTCEIKLTNGKTIIEITENEIDGFNDFKFYLLEQTGRKTS